MKSTDNQSLFEPVYYTGAARRAGWYVADHRRGLTDIFVGGRHATAIEAQSEARRLEISETRLRRT